MCKDGRNRKFYEAYILSSCVNKKEFTDLITPQNAGFSGRRCKARVCGRSLAGIAFLNSSVGMDVL
jgi:hypothetical protein